MKTDRDLCWPEHPPNFVVGRHVFVHTTAFLTTVDTTSYDYECRCCHQVARGKYLFDDRSHTTFSFYIITPLDALDA